MMPNTYLDVPMDDVVLVQVLNALQCLLHDGSNSCLWKALHFDRSP